MKKNEKAIIYGAVGLSVVAAYIYWKRKQAEKKATAETKKTFDPTTFGYPGPNTGPTPFQRKVMDIQSFLGVAVDGVPGPQTNGAWARRAPATFAKYGPIAPANIDFYNALVKGPANLII